MSYEGFAYRFARSQLTCITEAFRDSAIWLLGDRLDHVAQTSEDEDKRLGVDHLIWFADRERPMRVQRKDIFSKSLIRLEVANPRGFGWWWTLKHPDMVVFMDVHRGNAYWVSAPQLAAFDPFPYRETVHRNGAITIDFEIEAFPLPMVTSHFYPVTRAMLEAELASYLGAEHEAA